METTLMLPTLNVANDSSVLSSKMIRHYMLSAAIAFVCLVPLSSLSSAAESNSAKGPAAENPPPDTARSSAAFGEAFTPGINLSGGNRFRSNTGLIAHILPTRQATNVMQSSSRVVKPLTYHGGPVMGPNIKIYTIYWNPGSLQSGQSSSFSQNFKDIQDRVAWRWAGTGLGATDTQYYTNVTGLGYYWASNIGGGSGGSSWGGTWTDTTAFPASGTGCKTTAKPNCVDGQQLIGSLSRAMNANNWTGGYDKLYLIYTPDGENTCWNTGSCSYSQYCGWHTATTRNNQKVIFAHMPYGGRPGCSFSSSESPNNFPAADVVASVTSHEIAEAITDPLLNAWYDADGNENGDKCAWQYGSVTFPGRPGKPNQLWGGYPFRMQQEWSNLTNSCVISGP